MILHQVLGICLEITAFTNADIGELLRMKNINMILKSPFLSSLIAATFLGTSEAFVGSMIAHQMGYQIIAGREKRSATSLGTYIWSLSCASCLMNAGIVFFL